MSPLPYNVRVMRGFLPSKLMTDLTSYVRQTYDMVDRQIAGGRAHNDFVMAKGWGGLTIPNIKTHLGMPEVIGKVIKAIERKFPGGQVIDENSTFRRHTNPTTHVSWHIDADATLCAQYDPVYNVWMPLTPVGTDLPSIEVIESSDPKMRALPLQSLDQAIRTDEWRLQHFPGEQVLCPKLDPGDALLFSHYTLHRTQSMPNQRGVRMAAEFRFTMKNANPRRTWSPWFAQWSR
jgi:ectoine hydroxylase-related dioxygenase (phytanoyl-CoA dioxygenase family)